MLGEEFLNMNPHVADNGKDEDEDRVDGETVIMTTKTMMPMTLARVALTSTVATRCKRSPVVALAVFIPGA